MQIYNDADVLEKIVKDKQKELGPPPEDDVGSPKLKLRMLCNSLKFNSIRVFFFVFFLGFFSAFVYYF